MQYLLNTYDTIRWFIIIIFSNDRATGTIYKVLYMSLNNMLWPPISYTPLANSPAVGSLPNPATLHLPTINAIVEPPIPQPAAPSQESQPVTVGEGLPPIPGKLVRKIESGQFIDLGELLPDCLSTANATGDIDTSKAHKPATRPISSIIEWIQSYGIYTAILSKSQPHRVADLLGYQTLVLQAYQEFRGDSWLRYDHTFRQKAATSRIEKWATIDTTLCSLAFSGRGRSGPFPAHDRDSGTPRSSNPDPRSPRHPLVCFKWNRGNCSFPNCKFLHKCSYCVMDPGTTDTSHKATNCPYHPDRHPLPLPQDKYPPRKLP